MARAHASETEPSEQGSSVSGKPLPRLSMSALRQTIQFIRDPIPLIELGVEKQPDIFALNILGFGTWVFVCSPEGVEQMVRTPNDVLVAGEINHRFFSAFFNKEVLFTLDGSKHLERRKLLLPYFQDQHAVHFISTVERVAERMVDQWPMGRPFKLLPHLQEMSFRVIMGSVFGFEAFEDAPPIIDLLRRVAEEVYVSPLLSMPTLQLDLGRHSPWGRLIQLHAEMCAVLDDQIKLRRANGDFRGRKDVLSELLSRQEKEPDILTDQALRDELLVLLAAGFNATVFIICWVVECVLSFPETLEKVCTEIDTVVGNGPIDANHVSRMPYLDAVINESIRYRMPSPMAGVRLTKKRITLLGYEVPEGAFVSMCLAGLGLRPQTFPEPRQFRPERFLERKFSPYEWNPFGAGTRQCVGKGLGLVELRVGLATIFRKGKLRLFDSERPRERRGMFMVPKHGLRVILDARI